MILRDYQERAVRELRAAYAAGRRAPVLVLPTAGGKTIVASEIIRLSIAKQNRVLFAVPRIELLNQAVSKLATAGITDVRTIQASNDLGRTDAPVVIGSIPTLTTKRWLANPVEADLVIVDECHHGKARTHEQFLSLYRSSKLLGLTATPARGDDRALGDLFDSIVVGATVAELIQLEALVPCKLYAPPSILSTRELAQDPVDAYEKYVSGQKTIVFASTVEQARELSERFNQRGHSSKWLCAESKDRQEVLAAYSRREFKILVNVSLFVEGYDDPSIESAIFARRFTYVGSYLQAIGRVLRPFPGKLFATVVDLCGSALVHGTPDLEREYSLSGKAIRSSDRLSLRQCPTCFGVSTSPSERCPYCEHEYPRLARVAPKNANVALGEVTAKTPPTSWPMRAKRAGRCARCSGLIEQGAWMIYSKRNHTAMHTRCASQRSAA